MGMGGGTSETDEEERFYEAGENSVSDSESGDEGFEQMREEECRAQWPGHWATYYDDVNELERLLRCSKVAVECVDVHGNTVSGSNWLGMWDAWMWMGE